ncbi:MAG: DUF6383 domain-containing protein [Candidatus Azobacteroides sp.]|nr:DUF6383 domain-containing protein [Candidatus Azobacteroides sp.]
MKNITKKMAFLAILAGCIVQANAQTVFLPETGAEYRIKVADGEHAGKTLTYKGYNPNKDDGVNPYFEDNNPADFNQVFRFVLINGTETQDGNPEYFIESVVDQEKSAMNDRGLFSRERNQSWHALRVYTDKGKYAIKVVGSGATNQRFTIYLNGTTFGYRDNNATAEYKNEPPTEDYDFIFEKVTEAPDNSNLLDLLGHASSVMDKVEAKGSDSFGTTVLGQYDETAYNTLKNVYQQVDANTSSFASVVTYQNNLNTALNDLFASVAIPDGNYYIRKNDSGTFMGRIWNNKNSYLRFHDFNTSQKYNLLFSFTKHADNSIQIKYEDSKAENVPEDPRYLSRNANATTTPNPGTDNVIFHYDISTGDYAMQFVNEGGFIRFDGTEIKNSGINVPLSEYFLFTPMEEAIAQSVVDLQAAVKNAVDLQTILENDGYEYNPEIVTSLRATLAESEELVTYPTTQSEMEAKKALLETLMAAYPKGRLFSMNEEGIAKISAADWVGKESGDGKLFTDEGSDAYYGETKDGSTFMVGSFDFSALKELNSISIEYGVGQNTNGYIIEIYIADPTVETNKIASIENLEETGWFTPTETSTAQGWALPGSVTGIQEIYIKYVNTIANLYSIIFRGTRDDGEPTHIEKPEAKTTVFAQDGRIYARVNEPATIRLYTISGQLIDQEMVEKSYTKSVNQGIYIVTVNGKAYKVAVK